MNINQLPEYKNKPSSQNAQLQRTALYAHNLKAAHLIQLIFQ